VKDLVVLIGAGAIGLAIAKRVGVGNRLLLADLKMDNAIRAATKLQDGGFEIETSSVDVSSRNSVGMLSNKAKEMGNISGIIHAAGVPPSNSSPELIMKVDLFGMALVLEIFGHTINYGGSCVVVGSQAGHKLSPLTPEQCNELATTPVDELLDLPMLQADQISDSYHAYQIAKHGCTLRVMAEAIRWGERNARVNAVSPGIIETPLAENCPAHKLCTIL
jgi:NAD(P)-dependent dehydrogenase (short-subunit alcohol dehydrogenase family)